MSSFTSRNGVGNLIAKKGNSGERIPNAGPGFSGIIKKNEEGMMNVIELMAYVYQLASASYQWVLTEGQPFVEGFYDAISKVGPAIRMATMYAGGEIERIEGIINDLCQFSPPNDPNGVLESYREREPVLLPVLCKEVSYMAVLGRLVYLLRNAPNKEELEDLIQEAKDGVSDNARFVFESTKGNSLIRAFGRHYKLTRSAFGEHYHEFAEKQLAEAINTRSRELTQHHQAEVEAQKAMASADDGDLVDAEQLIFGDADGMSAVIRWKFNGKENLIRVRRNGDCLVIKVVIGKPEEAFKDLQGAYGEEPQIPLKALLDSQNNQRLCPEVEPTAKYRFGIYINDLVIQRMVRWVRTGLGYCVSSDFGGHMTSSGDISRKRRCVKNGGERLTDKEFFSGGIGTYELVFKAGFFHRVSGSGGKSTGQVLSITQDAVAVIQRRQGSNGKLFIVLESASTEELANILESAGMKIYEVCDGLHIFDPDCECEEVTNWFGVPTPLRNGLRCAYGRMMSRSDR